MEGIPSELDPLAQPATDDREGPAKRPERVVGFRKQQAGHALSGRWNLAPNEIGEQPPRFVAAEWFHADAVPLDPRPSQEVDAQSHVVPLAVTRAVTRPTVTLSHDRFKGREGTIRTHRTDRREDGTSGACSSVGSPGGKERREQHA
jgi:hypothetical protein